MRIFSGLTEAYFEIRRDLFEVGVWISGSTYQDKDVGGDPSFDFMELSPYVYSLTGIDDIDDYIEKLELSAPWIEAEFRERLGHGSTESHNPGEAWKLRRETWEEFLDFDNRFSYTYAERFRPDITTDQLSRGLKELAVRPASRQCIIQLFDPRKDLHNLGGIGRIPCSMFYQVMVRNKAVDLHYVMRSCDFFTHFPYDQLLALKLQRHAAHVLDRPVGIFHHLITSLHAFRKDFPEGVF